MPDPFDLAQFPEYHQPLPVDHEFRSSPGAPPGMGLQVRGHLGVFDGSRLVAYERSAWETMKLEVHKFLMRLFLLRIAAGSTVSFSVTDTGGTLRALTVWGPTGSSASFFNNTRVFDGSELQVGYGSDGTAPTGLENNLNTPINDMTASVLSRSGGLVNIKGTRTQVAAVTIRELGLKMAYNLDAVTRPRFLVDRATVAATPVGANNFVRVEFDLAL